MQLVTEAIDRNGQRYADVAQHATQAALARDVEKARGLVRELEITAAGAAEILDLWEREGLQLALETVSDGDLTAQLQRTEALARIAADTAATLAGPLRGVVLDVVARHLPSHIQQAVTALVQNVHGYTEIGERFERVISELKAELRERSFPLVDSLPEDTEEAELRDIA
jgi:hypothetical protein